MISSQSALLLVPWVVWPWKHTSWLLLALVQLADRDDAVAVQGVGVDGHAVFPADNRPIVRVRLRVVVGRFFDCAG